jgi:ketosteroid isomerase-like protein
MEEAGQPLDPRALVESYLQAFADRNVAQCLEFFHDDGLLVFGPRVFGLGRFRGKAALEQWHQERFERGMKIEEVEEILVEGDKVIVKAVASSPVLKSIQLEDFRGTATFVLEEGKIKEAHLGLRRGYRFHI